MIQFKGQLFAWQCDPLNSMIQLNRFNPYSWWIQCICQGSGQLNVIIKPLTIYLLISVTSSTSMPISIHIHTHTHKCPRFNACSDHCSHLKMKNIIATDIKPHNTFVCRWVSLGVVLNLLAFFFSFEKKKEKKNGKKISTFPLCLSAFAHLSQNLNIWNTYYRDDWTPSTYLTNVHRMNKTHRQTKVGLLMYSNRNTNHYFKSGPLKCVATAHQW